MWRLQLTIILNLPSISKDGRKHHGEDYHHYSHAYPNQLQLLYPLTVVQRQGSIVYHCNFNHNAAMAKLLHEVRDPPPATQNFRAYEHNSNSCKKTRKHLLHTFKNSRTNRQSTPGCSNAPQPMCRTQPTPLRHIRHIYPVVSAAN